MTIVKDPGPRSVLEQRVNVGLRGGHALQRAPHQVVKALLVESDRPMVDRPPKNLRFAPDLFGGQKLRGSDDVVNGGLDSLGRWSELMQARQLFLHFERDLQRLSGASTNETAVVPGLLDVMVWVLGVPYGVVLPQHLFDVRIEFEAETPSAIARFADTLSGGKLMLDSRHCNRDCDGQKATHRLDPGRPVERFARKLARRCGRRCEAPSKEGAEAKRHDQQNHCVSPERLFLHVHLPCGGWILARWRAGAAHPWFPPEIAPGRRRHRTEQSSASGGSRPLPPLLQPVASSIERAAIPEITELSRSIHVGRQLHSELTSFAAKVFPGLVAEAERVCDAPVQLIHVRYGSAHTFYRVKQPAFRKLVSGNRIERVGEVREFLVGLACTDREGPHRDAGGYEVQSLLSFEHQSQHSIEPVLLFPPSGSVRQPGCRDDADTGQERLRPSRPDLRLEARRVDEPGAKQGVGHVDPSGWVREWCGGACADASGRGLGLAA
ncbi:hypothetical protein NB717_000058 [Xanthomonas sacchari]|nr:hypothetical protein [Xanthomonas sacchari]